MAQKNKIQQREKYLLTNQCQLAFPGMLQPNPAEAKMHFAHIEPIKCAAPVQMR